MFSLRTTFYLQGSIRSKALKHPNNLYCNPGLGDSSVSVNQLLYACLFRKRSFMEQAAAAWSVRCQSSLIGWKLFVNALISRTSDNTPNWPFSRGARVVLVLNHLKRPKHDQNIWLWKRLSEIGNIDARTVYCLLVVGPSTKTVHDDISRLVTQKERRYYIELFYMRNLLGFS